LIPFDKQASWNLSFLHEIDALNNRSDILSASYSRSLPYDASMFATVFDDFGTNKNLGIIVGFSIPLGPASSVTSTVSAGQGGPVGTVDAVRSMGTAIGDYGWEVRDAEGATSNRGASLSYRSQYGTTKVGVNQAGTGGSVALEQRGSIIGMDGNLFFSDWVNNAFAVVDAGAPGVDVSYENRPIGKTDANGMLLVPTLRSYEKNTIAIDPANLPVDSEISSTRDVLAPADRAGVLVRFNVQSDSAAALVSFVRSNGSFVPPGATGKLESGEDFIVGYDGQAFVKRLANDNSAILQFDNVTCHAQFHFAPQPGAQVRIGPVTCQ
jgi:outer membrane usher protein